MKKTLLSICFMVLLGVTARGQSTVTGNVTDAEDGTPLPGVTVLEKGTSNGAVTDVDGNYRINLTKNNAVLVLQYLGFATAEYTVGNQSVIDVALEPDILQLGEIVVTAYGIEKSRKSLGYSTSKVGGEELVQAKEVSFTSQLQGKVAGLDITKPTTGPAGSSRITIRGLSSLGGANQPLIVIDGVPIDNTNLSSGGLFGGVDTGDGLSAINQDDIESIDVLKGASAGTLYGERGANGVVIITTKKGTAGEGVRVDINSNYTIDEAAIFPRFQRLYGQGANGRLTTTAEEAIDNPGSWGPQFNESLSAVYFDGETRPYVDAGEDDIKNFYENGSTLTNSVAISGGGENYTARLSMSNVDHSGVVPNSQYDRYTANILTTLNLNKFSMEMKANWVNEEALNRTNLSDFPTNPGKTFTFLPANISVDMLRRTRDPNNNDPRTNAIAWSNNGFVINPFWGSNESVQEDHKQRFIGYLSAAYQFTDWLNLKLRVSRDYTNHDYFIIEQIGSEFRLEGGLSQLNYEVNDNTLDALLNYNDRFGDNFGLNVNVGMVSNRRSRFQYQVSGTDFIVPFKLAINNLANINPGNFQTVSRIETNAIYATALFDYKGYLFLEGSVRNDWYSTLTNPLDPEGSDNTALYGSGSLSFVFTDVFDIAPNVLSSGKLRATYGTAGSANISPFGLLLTYAVEGIPYDGRSGSVSLGRVNENRFPSVNLEPEITRTLELGTELNFFNNRMNLDFTYYRQSTINQLLPVSVSQSSSFSEFLVNAGDVENTGIEAVLGGRPVKTTDFAWDVSLNFTRNRNEIVELAENLNNLSGEPARFGANVRNTVGGQVGDMYGTVFERDEAGNIVHNENGLPIIAQEREFIGNFNPDWFGGITNTLTYKNFSLGFVIDTKQGGEIYSLTSALSYGNGKHINTVRGRENPLFEILGEGVNENGEVNNNYARLDDYYGTIGGVAEENTYDASFIKLRQVTLGYTLPQSLLSNAGIRSARISLTARNLFFIQNGLSEIGLDPEAVYNAGTSGFEYSSLPGLRSYGVNINLSF